MIESCAAPKAFGLLAMLLSATPLPAEAQGARLLALALPGYRLHVLASEELDPDRVRALARPGSVLWLSTRSNVLRDSAIENLARFSEAYVQMRPPIEEAHERPLRRAPRAGIWVTAGDLKGRGLHWLGSRQLAVAAKGPLTFELAERLAGSRAARIEWEPEHALDLLSWSQFRQLPGVKLVRAPLRPEPGGDALPCPAPKRGEPAAWVDARRPLAELKKLLPCPMALRARVDPAVSDEALSWLYSRDPALELEVEVACSEQRATQARGLLVRLEHASARP